MFSHRNISTWSLKVPQKGPGKKSCFCRAMSHCLYAGSVNRRLFVVTRTRPSRPRVRRMSCTIKGMPQAKGMRKIIKFHLCFVGKAKEARHLRHVVEVQNDAPFARKYLSSLIPSFCQSLSDLCFHHRFGGLRVPKGGDKRTL